MKILALRSINSFIFVCIFGFSGFNTFGQDTLRFKNGNIQVLEILKVSEDKQVLEVLYQGRMSKIALGALSRYSLNGAWIDVSEEFQVAQYPVQQKILLMDRTYFDRRTGFSIGTNLSSIFMGFQGGDDSGSSYSIRPLFSLEPEYRFKNRWLSFRGSFEIGVPAPSLGDLSGSRIRNGRTSVNNGVLTYTEFDPSIESIEVNRKDQRLLDRYIRWQTGLSLKFWTFEKFRERLYVQL